MLEFLKNEKKKKQWEFEKWIEICPYKENAMQLDVHAKM